MKEAQPSSSELPADVAKLADAVAATHGVDPALVRGVIWVESRGKANAKSPKGALGLMQLMPLTAAGLGVQDALNPHANVDGGTRYLAQLLRKYGGDQEIALAAYNWGPGNVDAMRAGATIPDRALLPRGVADYAKKVLDRAALERRRAGNEGLRIASTPFQSSTLLPLELSCPSCSHSFGVVVEMTVRAKQ